MNTFSFNLNNKEQAIADAIAGMVADLDEGSSQRVFQAASSTARGIRLTRELHKQTDKLLPSDGDEFGQYGDLR